MTKAHAVHSRTRPRRVLTLLALLLLDCKPRPDEEPSTVPTAAPACEGAEAIDLVWTKARRSDLQAALATLPGEWPTQMFATIDARVTDGREPWREAYTRACEKEDLLAQRCLDRSAWELDGVVAVIVENPARAVELWPEADGVLTGFDICPGTHEPTYDTAPLRPELGRELLRMRLLLNLDEQPALDEAVRAMELVDIITGTPAFSLQLHATKAVAALRAGKVDEAAGDLALAAKLGEQLGPRARASLGHANAIVAFRRNDVEAGLRSLEDALVAAREQSDPWLVFTVLRNLGTVRIEAGDHAGAVPPLTEAVALSTRLAGSENPHTADVQLTLASALLALGQIEAAHDLLTQARDSFVATLGPDHPMTLSTVAAIARVLVSAGRPFEANHALLDLLEVYTELYGPKDAHTALIKLELGDTLMSMNEQASARTMYLEALPPLVQALGADHRDVIRCAIHLGIAELALGNLEEAETHCRRGSDLVKALPPEDPLVAEVASCVEQLDSARKKKKKKPR